MTSTICLILDLKKEMLKAGINGPQSFSKLSDAMLNEEESIKRLLSNPRDVKPA
jgi:hypothetical protein